MTELQLQFKRETGIDPEPDEWEVEPGELIEDKDGDEWSLIIVWKNYESINLQKPFDVYPQEYIEWLENKLNETPKEVL